VADAREGASLLARIGADGPVSPPTAEPVRSQMCTNCRRNRQVVTLSFGKYRSRLCSICMGRPDKTTEVKAIDCAHRFSKPGADGRVCIDCFEPVPSPVEVGGGRCACELCRETGAGDLGLILCLVFLTTVLAGLAGATGKLRAAVLALPLPEPALNGYPLAVLLVAGAGCWWRMRRVPTPAHEFDELAAWRLEKLPRGTEPNPVVIWPTGAGEVGPDPDGAWCTGIAAPLIPGDPARRVYLSPPRRQHPRVPFADRHPDPEELNPTLLPEGRVQS